MQWSHNMVHSHFTLCLRDQDYIKWLSQHPWYNLWMRVKGPHHYKVTALGSCVKWPLFEHAFGRNTLHYSPKHNTYSIINLRVTLHMAWGWPKHRSDSQASNAQFNPTLTTFS